MDPAWIPWPKIGIKSTRFGDPSMLGQRPRALFWAPLNVRNANFDAHPPKPQNGVPQPARFYSFLILKSENARGCGASTLYVLFLQKSYFSLENLHFWPSAYFIQKVRFEESARGACGTLLFRPSWGPIFVFLCGFFRNFRHVSKKYDAVLHVKTQLLLQVIRRSPFT